jgi:hypothetical protein
LDQRAQGQLRREYADVSVVARICVGRECNAELEGNIFAKTTAEMDLMARYIDQYCLEHPAASVVVATDKLVKELIAR